MDRKTLRKLKEQLQNSNELPKFISIDFSNI